MERSRGHSDELPTEQLPLRQHRRSTFANEVRLEPSSSRLENAKETECSSDPSELRLGSNSESLDMEHLSKQLSTPTPEVSIDPWASTTEDESASFWGIDENVNSPSAPQKLEMDSSHTSSADGMLPSTSRSCDTTTDHHDVLASDAGVSKAKSLLSDDYQCRNGAKNPHCDNVQCNVSNTPESAVSESSHTSALNKSDIAKCDITDTVNVASCDDDDSIDPRCLSDHEDGTLFVVNDTDESDIDSALENCGEKNALKWQPAVKRNPYNLRESLWLSLEEVSDVTAVCT